MPLELVNPETLHTPQSYTHVVVASGRLVFVSGQASDDTEGNLVRPGDLAAQARHQAAFLSLISEARVAVFGDHKPADTLIGVETLAEPGYLIEIEAIAVLD